MPRIAHGASVTLEQVEAANRELTDALRAASARLNLPIVLPDPTPALDTDGGASTAHEALIAAPALHAVFPFFRLHDVGYMFEDLQASATNLLPKSPTTVAALIELAAAMSEPAAVSVPDSTIPAVYTYFGQFVDHDITSSVEPGNPVKDADRVPLSLSDVKTKVKNARTSPLDLDSVYGTGAVRVGDKFLLGEVTTGPFPRPAGTAPFGVHVDLPREPPSADPVHDRAALIGDPRNDENLFISQMQVAFLRAHNALIDKGMSFAAAKKAIVQHYQWVLLHDFLPRIADPSIVATTLAANTWYKPTVFKVWMPLEFSVAGFRFGHSMVRETYDYNSVFTAATLTQLFTFTAFSGDLAGLPTLPQNWIADWRRMIDGPTNRNHARRIDTLLVKKLADLPKDAGSTLTNPIEIERAKRLAERNLVRGYRLRMPTGQAVAHKLGLTPLTPAQFAASVPTAQATVLRARKLDRRTPLWFYVLAEAAHSGGSRLGPVGSTIVAETLIGLARRTANSILGTPGWTPTLGTGATFTLADFFRLGGVLA
jgi:hypothetical protein